MNLYKPWREHRTRRASRVRESSRRVELESRIEASSRAEESEKQVRESKQRDELKHRVEASIDRYPTAHYESSLLTIVSDCNRSNRPSLSGKVWLLIKNSITKSFHEPFNIGRH